MPEFTYDTPYAEKNDFYQLLEDDRPLFVLFLRNMGHPLTRHYILRYAETRSQLRDARLAVVVRSRPESIARNFPEGSLPCTVLCDAEGALYDYAGVQMEPSRFRAYSLEGLHILKDAAKAGFEEDKNAPQQLPLTLLLGREGEVLMAQYGTSITDQPASCGAMQDIMDARRKLLAKLDAPAAPAEEQQPEAK